MGYPERIDPDDTEPGVLALHLKRYEFALAYCDGATVLDAACGIGYGSAHLASVAASVLGIDASSETIATARTRYRQSNLAFEVGDMLQVSLPDESIDVICSFETIEHVVDPERALDEFRRVLRSTGTLFVSTPNATVTTSSPPNPFHTIEWSAADFRSLLRLFFEEIELYGQRRVQTRAHRIAQRLDVFRLRRHLGAFRSGAKLLGTTPTADLTLDDVIIDGDLVHATEIVAVCRSPRR